MAIFYKFENMDLLTPIFPLAGALKLAPVFISL